MRAGAAAQQAAGISNKDLTEYADSIDDILAGH